MLKKILKISVVVTVMIGSLLMASFMLSNYRMNKYRSSVVNEATYTNKQIAQIFEDSGSDTVYLFLYDADNDDCVYLDEVLLKQISYEHNGIRFDNIYKVKYEQSYRSYINQLIQNTYDIQSFPAIVAFQRTSSGYETVDRFEYGIDQNANISHLTDFLERNGLFDTAE